MELAARRHGVVTAADLAAAGLVRRAVSRRVAQGRLRRLHRGVFLVGPLEGPRTREMAAVLAVGHDAAISHRSAAALWEILPPVDDPIVDVSVTRGHPRHRPGIQVHRTRRLHRSVNAGIPVTTPLRTLVDLAAVSVDARELERAVEEAQVRRLVTRRDLEAQGNRFASAVDHEPSLTRSEAERRLLALIRAARLPPPRTNVRVAGYEVDFMWPQHRLVVEVDGFAFHSTRAAFERDRARDRALLAAGYVVLRITWRQLVHEPEVVVAELAAALVRQRAFVP
jgi:very-short-patch-repair endonuclease